MPAAGPGWRRTGRGAPLGAAEGMIAPLARRRAVNEADSGSSEIVTAVTPGAGEIYLKVSRETLPARDGAR